ncbi:chondroitinase-B domain-containing protein [Paenibacillus roseipurpureus]|uniref:Chondroitinase-B domain-containing protein n=1 Tax=Paenibacillus roseopurpureus TaxID=2918901 RepID=A0AA96LMH8_9BACL|nr:chondroitinase-B domain-containing protein [Paenibacillus sp. MBLB1832]WNR43827.1 chondroitinase-B domain-containing protein [Paenibacillus sp. MBLB1832]
MKIVKSKKMIPIALSCMLSLPLLPLATPAFAATLLSDNFESYSSFPSGAWTNASGNGTWSIATDGSKVATQTSSTSNTYIMTNGTSTWTNYTYSAKVKVGSTSVRNGIVARYTNGNNYYFLILYNGNLLLNKKVSGSTTTIQQVPFTANTSTFYNLQLEVNGTSVKGYVDGVLLVQGTDSSLTNGVPGLYANGIAEFDDVSVTDSAVSDTQAPTVPTGLSATAASSSQINLSWTASTDNVGVTGYDIYRDGSLVGSSATTSYSDTGLNASTAYSYTIKAKDAAGNISAASSTASATTQASSGDTTPPTAPTGLTANAVSSSQINLSWTASTDNVGVTGYDIYRGGSLVGSSATTSYNDSGLSASTSYSYTVKAKDAAGNVSVASSSASATTQASGGGTVVNVSTSAQLTAAISSATAGTTIVLANGTYTNGGNFSVSGKTGTAANPITIKAANTGQAIISGGAYFVVTNSSYVTIEGLKFTNTGNTAVKLDQSNNVRVTRNTFALTENGNSLKWVYIGGANSHHNRIDHNEFGPKHDLGNFITVDGSSTQISQYDTIEYNYFHDIGPRAVNEMEAIRLGVSTLSMSDAFATIQYNLFENCDGDPEFVSVKSGQNTVRYNTFRNSQGVLSSRHGHGQSFYGNFFLGDGVKSGIGGIRLYANDHKVFNNYFENLTGSGFADAINVDGGDFDGGTNGSTFTSSDLSKHWRVYRAQIVNNTIVNSTTGIVIGGNYTLAPVDSIIANNIVKNSTGTLYNQVKTSNTTFQGNIGYGSTLSNVTRTSAEINNVNPLLTSSGGLQKLSSSSPAINASTGSYTFVTTDMDGQSRSGTNDVGADEYATSSVINSPLTTSDVGPLAP